MSSRLVVLVEERSMKLLLEALIPRFFPRLQFLCIAHQGKQDLERSIPRKLRAWTEPGVRFLIVRDNDGGDCRDLKQRLQRLCSDSHRRDARVRIACEELEAWYFGDLEALAEEYGDPSLATLGSRARYREPDAIAQPSAALIELVPTYQKLAGARRMGARLSRSSNRSRSFQVTVALLAELERAS